MTAKFSLPHSYIFIPNERHTTNINTTAGSKILRYIQHGYCLFIIPGETYPGVPHILVCTVDASSPLSMTCTPKDKIVHPTDKVQLWRTAPNVQVRNCSKWWIAWNAKHILSCGHKDICCDHDFSSLPGVISMTRTEMLITHVSHLAFCTGTVNFRPSLQIQMSSWTRLINNCRFPKCHPLVHTSNLKVRQTSENVNGNHFTKRENNSKWWHYARFV